jgi:hypothetical protein
MKKIVKNVYFLLLVLIALTLNQCSKKKDDAAAATCKTCKAFNTNGTVAAERKTCNAADEQGFRAENAGKGIICN